MTASRTKNRLDYHLGGFCQGNNQRLNNVRQFRHGNCEPDGDNRLAAPPCVQGHSDHALNNFDVVNPVKEDFWGAIVDRFVGHLTVPLRLYEGIVARATVRVPEENFIGSVALRREYSALARTAYYFRLRFARCIGITITAKTNTTIPNTAANSHHSQDIQNPTCVSVGRSIAPVRCNSPTRSLGIREQERPSTNSISTGGPARDVETAACPILLIHRTRRLQNSEVGGSATPVNAAHVFSVTSRGSCAAPIRRAA